MGFSVAEEDTVKRDTATIALGLLLVFAGVLFLLANFGLFQGIGNLVIALFFAAGGVVFLLVFLSNTEQWWAVFPGCALLGIGGLIGLDTLFPSLAGVLGGSLFLGALALSFWIVYAMHPEHWWAVIPGGVLLTLAAVAGLSNTIAAPITGSIFFFGLALTFGLLYLLPTQQGRQMWAIYPAGATLLLGLVTLISVGGLMTFIWPALLIAAGLYLVYRNTRRREL